MLPDVIDGLCPGGEQPVQLRQIRDLRGTGLGQLGQELAADSPEKSFYFPPAFRLTGQSWLILWITGRWMNGLLSGFAAGAFEAADGFLVAADLGGDGFEAAAQLVDLDGQAGQGGGVLAAGAVFLDDGAQVGPPVKGGPADARTGGYFPERDRLPGGGQLGAGGLDPGQLVAVSPHGPGR
jgi:hypothetical protein